MTCEERNAIFAEHINLIGAVLRRNRPLVRAMYDSPDDAFQDLALELLRVIETYDAGRGANTRTYFSMKLKYRLLQERRQQKPYGMTGAHYTVSVTPLDKPINEDESIYPEIPVFVDFVTDVALKDAFSLLDDDEREVAEDIASGARSWAKCPRDIYLNARSKLVMCYAG